MQKIIRAILFFPSVTRAKIGFLLIIILVATLFEGFGVAMLFPVMDFIEKGKDFSALSESSRMWSYLAKGCDLFSIPKNLIALMAIVFCLLMVRQLFNYFKYIYSSWITESLFSDIRSMGFQWFVKADMPFYDIHGIGQLINVLTVDGVRAGGGIFAFFNLLAGIMIFITYFILLLILSPGMTLFAMIIMGFVGIILKSRITKSGKIGNEVSRYNEAISSSVVERLNGIKLLKLSATEDKEIDLVKRHSEKIKMNSYNLAKIRANMELVVDPMVILAGLTILFFSVEIFHMSLAETGVFIFVLLRLMPYTKEIFYSWQVIAGNAGSLFRVQGMMDRAKDANLIKGGNIEDFRIEKEIRFTGISFQYNRDNSFVLDDVNVVIPAGKLTALVGRSGAGKSTLIDLIPRLRVPQKGKITIDDTLIEEMNIKTLRRAIAFVSQEGFLFNDTIENNVRYCRPSSTMDDVIYAAKMAYADHFIREFPDGYDTVVGERGMKLSGGQRQRIILARALLQKASIIILDEPTSSLDSESEIYIQKAMDEIRTKRNVTLIIIAHRLSTIRSADQIIVLDRGRVIEHGSHSELMHDDAWYADMVKIQAVG